MLEFKATYSPEDNKLRLYASERLDPETFKEIRDHGFKWAPRQELFVAPRWTPSREDFLIGLAGMVTAEASTMVSRAADKVERLDIIAANAATRANGYQSAAATLSSNFANGQPILMGHHSQRKHENDLAKMDRAQANAAKELDKIDYWHHRAAGVVSHANRKNCDRTRSNRVKTLLTELRNMQRAIVQAEKGAALWLKISKIEDLDKQKSFVKSYIGHHQFGAGVDMYYKFDREEITAAEVITKLLNHHQSPTRAAHRQRWILHILNRLGYEQAGQADTPRFMGTLNKGKIQTFCRTHGADKPDAELVNGFWVVQSSATLPLHIGKGETCLALDAEGWLDLMQSVGYTIPAPIAKAVQMPLLNFKADTITLKRGWKDSQELEQVAMTKAEYKSKYGCEVSKSICGKFRVRTFFQSDPSGNFFGKTKVVFLTDSKEHPAPEQEAANAE